MNTKNTTIILICIILNKNKKKLSKFKKNETFNKIFHL